MMNHLLRPLGLALGLLTTLPTPVPREPSSQEWGFAPLMYPLVGLVLSALLLAAGRLVFELPPLVAAALLLTFWTLLSGAMHLDGLADCTDALAAGHGDSQRRQAVLRDPHVGGLAVVVLVLLLLGKYACIAAALERGDLVPLLLAPVLARTATLALMCTLRYVSPGGMAETITTHLPRRRGRQVLAVVALLGLFLAPLALLGAAVVTWLVGRAARRRLGGATGDVYGAAIELVELTVLLLLTRPAGV
ncbi:adenosylcobinamide-GDP ribazoletransferase [Immundisolibacter sp.]|uniref:adenosylcobinamide-GDP ribazoletransferase n=1 Tax=Immundisolibacter sp. TaxID=1934948 RepID=UPI003569B4DA